MAPHLERWNDSTREWEEIPGTHHRTNDSNSNGYKKTTRILKEMFANPGPFTREVADKSGDVCGTLEMNSHLGDLIGQKSTTP